MAKVKRPDRVAVVYGTRAGIGGLGHSVAAAITSIANSRNEVVALGPGYATPWPLPGELPQARWLESPSVVQPWMASYTWLRWRAGQLTLIHDSRLGSWAVDQIQRLQPESCYLFTQVALETLRWARQAGIPTVLDNPNGHIRNFQRVCEQESFRWFGKSYKGHPTTAMVDRVEEEYHLADRIRVYSEWGKKSMVQYGVSEEKLHVVHQTVNLQKFRPASHWPDISGPLRVCYVGSLDLRKGFVYLLQAIKAIGAKRIRLQIVGATGDRNCVRLLAHEAEGLQIECAPRGPIPVYQQSELFVVPTLEDGLPFVLVEGLACGLPVIVTDQAGAAECVRTGQSGWIVPAGRVEPLAAALEDALRRRSELQAMGQEARSHVEQYAGPIQIAELFDWYYSQAPTAVFS